MELNKLTTTAGLMITTNNNKLTSYALVMIIKQGPGKMKWLRNLINKVRLEIRYRKKLKELRKRDPFIYK
jgi:dephospho-CoA kinase